MASVWGCAPHGNSRADTHRADAERKYNVAFAYYNVGVQNSEVHAQKKWDKKSKGYARIFKQSSGKAHLKSERCS